MATIGSIDRFNSEEESWQSYIERFELFFDCNDIDNEKKVSTLLTVMGVRTYALLRDLITPDKPSTKTYKQIVDIIGQHLHPKPSFITERFKFSRRNQLEHETVSDYIVQLKQLSQYCQFGDKLPDYLRDRLVSGLKDHQIQKRLLGEENLTYEKSVQLATSMEFAERGAAQLTHRPGRLQNVAERQSGSSGICRVAANSRQMQQTSSSCNCCGRSNHSTSQCRYREYVCNYCKKKGHLEKVCRSKNNFKKCKQSEYANKFHEQSAKAKSNKGNKQFYNVKSHSRNHYVEEELSSAEKNYAVNDEVYDIANLFQVHDENKRKKVEPIQVQLLVENRKVNFEVDSGACVSVMTEKDYKAKLDHVKIQPTNLVLSSYTQERIVPIGKISVKVKHNGDEKQLELYIVPNGANPLLGRDWIQALKLIICIPSGVNKLQSAVNYNVVLDSSFQVEDESGSVVTVATTNDKKMDLVPRTCDESKLVKQLYHEFPKVFEDKLGCFKGEPVKLKLKPNAIPKYHKPRTLPFTLRDKVESELERLENEGVISPVNTSEWATPIVPVLKTNGQIRICGDFKVTLNPFLEVDRHPLPRIEELFASLQNGEKFSKIDLSQAYQQLTLEDESKKYCTISTHNGLFAYNRLCYGISSAPGIFQRTMEQTLQGIPGMTNFQDDILITGANDLDHLNNLRLVCKRLQDNGFTVSKSKCKFFCDSIEYLGFVISKQGLHTAESKVSAILRAPEPKDVTQLNGFLGLVNYYARFIPKMSTILTPMYTLLKKDTMFVWNQTCKKAFEEIKQKLVSAQVLAHFDPKLKLTLACDASQYGIAAVLSQIQEDGTERPISFASRILNDAERKYAQIDKEALSIVYGVKKFNQYLYGNHFLLKTDHKPLVAIFGPKKGLPAFAASRLQRYALFLSGFQFDISYVKSQCHGNADGLSRLPVSNFPCDKVSDDELYLNVVGTYLQCMVENDIPLSYSDIMKESMLDPITKKIIGYVQFGWPEEIDQNMNKYFVRRSELTLEQGILMWGHRIIIPQKFRTHILQELHNSHMGIVRMKALARSYVWWPNIDDDIEQLANNCSSCLKERANPPKSFLHVWNVPDRAWSRIHIDFFGPFQSKLFLIVKDAFSKWTEVLAVPSTAAKHTISHLRDLFARYGLVDHIVSDNGPPFTSNEFKTFLISNGVKHSFSPPYHPQTNGLVENAVKTVKSKLRITLHNSNDLDLALTNFLFTYRNTIHSTTNQTPAKLMLGRSLKSRLDLIRPKLKDVIAEKQNKQISNYGGSRTRQLHVNQPVLAKDFRGRDKWIEAVVTSQLGPVTYLVELGTGLKWKRHIDQLIGLQSKFGLTEPQTDNITTQVNHPDEKIVEAINTSSHQSVDTETNAPLPSSETNSPSSRSAFMQPNQNNQHDTPTSYTCTRNVISSPAVDEQSTPQKRYPARERKRVVRLDL